MKRAERLNVHVVGFEELLRSADYVSLHALATEHTRGMVDARELEMIESIVYLITAINPTAGSEPAVGSPRRSYHFEQIYQQSQKGATQRAPIGTVGSSEGC
ncbi:MAG: hypothetical protein H5T69_16360 [Chloroflexi bacterium]|nr:hypothetical protein [Chloroflexota bacterium]